MTRKVRLSIKKPCQESFDQFEPTHAGGFCHSCQKEVIDFSQMSEREILDFFRDHQGKTCGRFQVGQLKTYTEFSSSRDRQSLRLFGMTLISASVLALFPMGKNQAQQSKSRMEMHLSAVQEEKSNMGRENTDGGHFVEGVVRDKDRIPLTGVSVHIKGTNIGTLTDEKGRFKFSEAFNTGDILIFSYIGFTTKEYKIPKGAEKTLNIEIEFAWCDIEMMGEVVVDQIYHSKPTIWQRVKNIFR